ncbi:MAG: hypothetical protein JWP12_2633 [Bacteroidetes bacterium]|nr:hypothetical protein [Bacteroidota bacterium]
MNTTFYRLRKVSKCVKAVILLSLFSFSASAQIFWTEDWTSGGGTWTLNVPTGTEGADPNFFTISDNEGGGITPNLGAPTSCGVAGNGNNTLHVTSVFNPSGGASYDAGGLCGILFCPQTDRRTESPSIDCTGKTGISVNFNYIENGQATSDNATLFYFNGSTWIQIDDMPKTLVGCGGQGLWRSRTVALPASADNNPNVKIAFRWVNNDDGAGVDPSLAVDDISLSVVTTTNTITTGTITGSPFCACSTISVPFTSTGAFTAGNIYTAQLSNAAGSFAAPTAIGTLASIANTGTISCTIPCAAVTGTLYRIRVVSSAPAITGTDNGVNITINATVTPSVTIAASPAGAICAGTSVTFTATPTNGGTTPGYQWQVNGTNVGGATTSTFTSSTLANGNVVTVVMTSTAACPSPATATSPGITMVVNPTVTPSVTIAASPAGAICAGTSVTFTATPTNGGTTPTYQWQVNGTNVGGATTSTFTSTTLANGDVVTVIMTSTAACPSPATATSSGITMTVNPTVTPSVSITSSGSTICAGDPVTFTATPTNGGTTPTYQWQVNGTNAGGATASTFTSSTLVNGDNVTVIVTSNAPCASPATATSNTITITVSAAVAASVSITSSGSTICAGDPVTFTATPTGGGTTPTYQWQVNGSNVGGATASTFTSSTLVNGDNVTVIMTSSSSCATGSPATSNAITITVSSAVPASVSITASPAGSICAGTSVTFTAAPTNGGSTPAYQWQVNGANVSGETAATFTSTTLVNGDVVTVIMTSSSSCATGSPATSNAIVMSVTTVTPSVSIVASPSGAICSGQSVTFTASPTNGGSAPTYQWQVNGINAGTGATFTSTTLANGDVVTVILTSSDPCASPTTATSNAITMTVNSTQVPSVSIVGAPTTVCAGNPVGFAATATNGGTTPSYQWQVNGTNAGTDSPTFTSSTLPNGASVTCILTSSSACASPTTATSNAVVITVNTCTPPVANFSGTPQVMCQAGCVNFTDLSTNSPTSWNWQFPGGSPSSSTSQNPNVCYSANGSYTVILIVSNASGADTLVQAGFITVGQPVTVNITGNLLITSCEKTELTAVPTDGTYSWGPGGQTTDMVSVSPAHTQQYWVTYTSPDGCTDSDTTTVVVKDLNTYFLPTGFTPNGDGVNDEIQLHGRGIDFFTLRIFDRIGEKVFETSDIDKGWDGRLHGLPMNDGVFVYELNITFCNGENVKKHGDITLVK